MHMSLDMLRFRTGQDSSLRSPRGYSVGHILCSRPSYRTDFTCTRWACRLAGSQTLACRLVDQNGHSHSGTTCRPRSVLQESDIRHGVVESMSTNTYLHLHYWFALRCWLCSASADVVM